MDKRRFSAPVPLGGVTVTDAFWRRAMELVRTEVIPYQWETLNDRVEGAAPSFCVHNFRAAGRLLARKAREGEAFTEPAYTFRGFETLPEDPAHPDEDAFYGFVFQDSDFYKWLEAVAYALSAQPDPDMEALADGAIDLICGAQREDGYLDTYYIVNGMDGALTNLRDHHELYCLGHLIEAAVAYREATGKDKLLRAACRYADYAAARFGREAGKRRGYPGHEIAEMALIRLYEATGEGRYLALAQFFLDERGQEPNFFIEEEKARAAREGKRVVRFTTNPCYHQAHKPVREQEEAVGHAVRAVYLYSGMADAARVTGDESLYAACERLWKDIASRKLYVTGGIGGTREGEAFSFPYDLPGDLAYSETCAAIGLAFFARRMLQIRADSRYADVMEMALHNTVLAGMALDGKSFFYVNPLTVLPEACRRDERLSHVKPVRQKWFGCACCPPNIARMVSSIAQYAYTQAEDTLYTHLYIGGEVKTPFGAKLSVETDMPWGGRVEIAVREAAGACGTLALRIPGWCGGYTLDAQGKSMREEDGYLYLSGAWQAGECVTLSLRMPVRMLAANPRVREEIGKVAFTRGPITYCCEEADNGPDLHLLRVDGARVGPGCAGVGIEADDSFGHRTVSLLVPGLRQVVRGNAPLYAEAAEPEEERVTLRLIPYYAWANRGEGEMLVWLRK